MEIQSIDLTKKEHTMASYLASHIQDIHKKTPEQTLDFHKLVWWLQDKYEWNNVETEGTNRVRFDWDSGKTSFWLNDDGTLEGPVPDEIKPDLKSKGIKYSNS